MAFNPGSGGGSNSIASAQDVSLSNVSSGEVLQYDNSVAKWINSTHTGIAASEKGASNGVATLNGSGRVPSAQLANPIVTVADGSPLPSVTNGAILYVYNPNGTL